MTDKDMQSMMLAKTAGLTAKKMRDQAESLRKIADKLERDAEMLEDEIGDK